MGASQTHAVVNEQVTKESIDFRGHPMVRSLHPTTIEVTMKDHLTARGDCIIGVSASKGCGQLAEGTKNALRRTGSRVLLRVVVGKESFVLTARGDSRLELSHPHEMVIRKSDFVSERTLALGASAAAKDIPRSLVAKLRNPETVGRLEIEVV